MTFSNAGLASGTLHRYRVKAFNLGGNSAASNIAEATTLPPIPQGVTSSVISSVQVNLAWTAVGGATGVRIERCQGTGCSNFVQVVQLTGATTYASTGLAPGNVYRYRLRADNTAGQSAYSPVVDATTPPSVPSSLTVTSGLGGCIDAPMDRYQRRDRLPDRAVSRHVLLHVHQRRRNAGQYGDGDRHEPPERSGLSVSRQGVQRRRQFKSVQYRPGNHVARTAVGSFGDGCVQQSDQPRVGRSGGCLRDTNRTVRRPLCARHSR